MPRLSTIKWVAAEPIGPNVLEAIASGCPSLRQLHIDLDKEDGPASLGRMDLNQTPLWSLPNLTQVSICQLPGPNFGASTKAMTAFLLACPAIEDLFLYRYCRQSLAHQAHLDEVHKLFKLATWPNLKRLSTEESYLAKAHDRFFRVHNRLTALSVQGAPPTPSEVVFTNMPLVTSLFISWIPSPGQLSFKVLHNITYLGMSIWGYSGTGRLDHLNAFLRDASNLTSLNINGVQYAREWLAGVVACVPRLRRLDIMWDKNFDNKGNMQKEPLPFRACLANLPLLTDLSSVDVEFWKLSKKPTTRKELDQQFQLIARSLAACSRSLCRVNVTSTLEESTWINIERTADGKGAGYTRVGGPEGLICSHWSNGYTSFDHDKKET
ncbi:hypothetical protein DXG01_003376 [Tephrocybe rancida]|nr:hypothetical protein DXG01_003376 [Tephrocybe rancida]